MQANYHHNNTGLVPTNKFRDSRYVVTAVSILIAVVSILHFLGRYGFLSGRLHAVWSELLTMLGFIVLSGVAFYTLRRAYSLPIIVRMFFLGAMIIVLVQLTKVAEAYWFAQTATYDTPVWASALREGIFAVGLGLFMASFTLCILEAHKIQIRLQNEQQELRRQIEERKYAQQAYGESAGELQAIYESLIDGLAIADLESQTLVRVNPALCAMLGYTENELSGKNIAELHPPEALNDVLAHFNALSSGHKKVAMNIPCKRKDGAIFFADIGAHALQYQGRPCTIGFFRDITERKDAEEKLHQLNTALEMRVQERTEQLSRANLSLRKEVDERILGEQHLADALQFNQTLIAASTVGILAYIHSGPCVLANDAAAQLVGTSVEKLLNQNFRKLLSWRASGLLAMAEITLNTGCGQAGEFDVYTSFGMHVWFDCHMAMFSDGGEKHLLLVTNDITARKRAEQALRKSENKYRELVQSVNSIILRMDVSGNITFCNEFALRFFGYSEQELIGRSVVGTIVPEKDSSGNDLAAMINDIGIHPERYANNENENIRHDGQRVWIAWTNRPVQDSRGNIQEILCVGNDITERVLAQRTIADQQIKMFHAARFSALGIMASGIAHEINNPLAVISAGAEQLDGFFQAQSPNNDPMIKITRTVMRNIDRIRRIIQGLRNLSRDGAADPFAKTSIENILMDTLELCQARFRNREIALFIQDVFPNIEIECRAAQLSQVLLNLLNNAHDAVERLPERWVRLDIAEEDDSVVFCVEDSGKRLPEDLLNKAFLPFYTTKKDGKAIGLGLSISKSIIESHGGVIDIDPHCPNTRFIVRIPKLQNALNAQQTPSDVSL